MVVSDMQWSLLDEGESQLALRQMNRPRLAATRLSKNLLRLAQAPPPPSSGEEWRVAEIKFKALKAGAAIPETASFYLKPLDPTLKRDATLSLNRIENGYYYYRWILKNDEAKKLGKWPVVAGLSQGVRVGLAAKSVVDRSAKIEEIRAGFIVVDSSGNRVDDDRLPPANSTAKFQAFIKVKQYNQSQWYSSDTNSVSYGGEWLGGLDFDGHLSSGVMGSRKKLSDSFRDALGLSFEWIRFDDKVVVNQGGNGKRFYGLIPRKSNSSNDPKKALSYDWPIEPGTSWWGFSASHLSLNWEKSDGKTGAKAKKTAFFAALPTNHNKYVYRGDNTNKLVSSIPGMSLPIYLPDPSAHYGWNGQISAASPSQVIGFDQDDPFFEVNGVFSQTKFNHQTNLHQELLREAGRFLGVPYGWGGQTFGGKQSLTSGFYTNSDTNAIPGEVPVLGSSIYNINGYGIDCSGFITEVAQRIGIPQPAGYPSGMDTGALYSGGNNGNNSVIIKPIYVRPGDFIVWRGSSGGHVIYVKATPDVRQNADGTFYIDNTQDIEADPNSGSTQGRVHIRTRSKSDWAKSGYVFSTRRWSP